MMNDIFLKLLNMSIAAGWLVLAVLAIRILFPKMPNWIHCVLWGLVGIRLMLPFALKSPLSLIPSAEVIPQDIAISHTPAIHSGIPAVNTAVNPALTQQMMHGQDVRQTVLSAAAWIWLAGVAALLIYSAVSYLVLRFQLRQSLPLRKNIRVCDGIRSPFVLGVFAPTVYLPSGMDAEQTDYVLAHEQAHISRRDHWWKPLGYLLLTVYWFHPLLWLAYILLCRDIERACDEKVIAALDSAGKKEYSQALLACGVRRRMIIACPVAFGEVSIKSRIKGVLHYKKPSFWVMLVSAVICLAAVVCFLTDPVPCVHAYQGQITVAATCTERGVQNVVCEKCQHCYAEPVEPAPHSFDAGTVTCAPTCTDPGVLTIRCADCDAHKTESIEKIAHTAGEPYTVTEPNCTQTGEKTATCTGCGVVFVTEVLATNDVHDLHETVVREATCTAEGEGVRECSRCDYTETCVYEKIPHAYTEQVIREANCREYALTQYRCANCAFTIVETGTELGDHSWTSTGYGDDRWCFHCGTWDRKESYTLFDTVSNPSVPEIPVIRIWP